MNVLIYTTQTCSFCQMAKDYFTSIGQQFTEIDVTWDPAKQQEMIEKSGQMGVPVIDIDGQLIIGFDKARIDSLLHRDDSLGS